MLLWGSLLLMQMVQGSLSEFWHQNPARIFCFVLRLKLNSNSGPQVGDWWFAFKSGKMPAD